ncbi:YbdD/YjiX family protein [Streptomyces sp. NP160]|uniref:YbdD/YjiX family protein n=1 Tax=Streptomyces sp. NP160 TaxID=2586637 RepID=UPI00111B0AE8|nr:YbdD/YjiX family protein [Streptomyces sp. NP160]TNM69935.1 YbdD/YjiX family protein [Streptomyces sp. NP160]
MRSRARQAVAGVRWYLREIGGTARWEAYLERCREHGHEPVSRREFERARTDAKAASPGARCC